jgi:hypothetical protein
MIEIPQQDGTMTRFPRSAGLEAFTNLFDRMGAGEDAPPKHPLIVEARNASESKWSAACAACAAAADEDVTGLVVSIVVSAAATAFASAATLANGSGIFTLLASERRGDAGNQHRHHQGHHRKQHHDAPPSSASSFQIRVGLLSPAGLTNATTLASIEYRAHHANE